MLAPSSRVRVLLRARMMRSVQLSSELGSVRWVATFTRGEPKGPSEMTGFTVLSASEKPALDSVDHCMGVRTASRSLSERSSPMPISSP